MKKNKNTTQKQPGQKKKKSDVMLTIALIIAIAVFFYAAYNLYHIFTEYKKGTDEYNSIEEMAVTERDSDSTEVAGPDAEPKPPLNVDSKCQRGCDRLDLCGCTSGYQLPDCSGDG